MLEVEIELAEEGWRLCNLHDRRGVSWSQVSPYLRFLIYRKSAPVFSAIGFSWRLETAKSLDLTYNNPTLLLWG